jgi:hypothetical protein
MGFVVSQEGASNMLALIVGEATLGTPVVHLMGTAGAPAHFWSLATYAALELPLSGGYAPQGLPSPGGDWTQLAIPSGFQWTSIVLSWTFTAALMVYGYYIEWSGASISWGGEEFNPSFSFPAGGGLFTWQLPLQLISCPGVTGC